MKLKRLGRPPKPDGRRLFIGLKVSPAENAALRRAAKAAGLSLSEFILRPHRRGRA